MFIEYSFVPASRARHNSRENKHGFCIQEKTSGGDWHYTNETLFLNVSSIQQQMLEIGLLYCTKYIANYTLEFERIKKFLNTWIYSQEIT